MKIGLDERKLQSYVLIIEMRFLGDNYCSLYLCDIFSFLFGLNCVIMLKDEVVINVDIWSCYFIGQLKILIMKKVSVNLMLFYWINFIRCFYI